MNRDRFKNIIKRQLTEISDKFQYKIPPEIISYISSTIVMYYRGIPLYLIDIKEKDPFKKNKTRGDVSLLLVGLFREWVNRINRPLKDRDYIKTGKISYLNAYLYLENRYGDIFYEELQKEYVKYFQNIYNYIEIFKLLSEEFEIYTQFLNLYKKEIKDLEKFLASFPDLKKEEFKENLKDIEE